jgi:NADPH:quinone reductase-like Zn-dependent oxidoreductase
LKVVEIRGSFGLDNLALAERPMPLPGPRQVLLRMRAASLNYRDLLMVKGLYNPKQPLPLIPCSDGVGVVEQVGDHASRFKPGERVAPIFAQRWIAGKPTHAKLRSTLGGPLDGTLAEAMVVDEEGLVRVPEHLDDEQAAALPCAAVTAWSALVTEGGVKAGDTVVILGTGGVAVFALQLAIALGVRAIVLSSSDEKLERVRQMGAWQGVNYTREPKWGRAVRELTDGEGADLVVEVGGAGTLEQSLSALRFGGRISLIGNLAGAECELKLFSIFMRQLRVQGILVGHREGFEAMNRAIAAHHIEPVVHRTFPLEDAREALQAMESGGHFGKICIRIAG